MRGCFLTFIFYDSWRRSENEHSRGLKCWQLQVAEEAAASALCAVRPRFLGEMDLCFDPVNGRSYTLMSGESSRLRGRTLVPAPQKGSMRSREGQHG